MSQHPTGRENTGAHAVGEGRRKRPIWLWIPLLLAAIAALLFLLSRCNNNISARPATPATTTAPTTTSPSSSPTASTTTATSPSSTGSTSSSTTGAASATTGASTAGTGSTAGGAAGGPANSHLTAGSMPLLPLTTSAPNGDLSRYVGRPAQARSVSVLSVPADEGFWVGTSMADRVWVQLVGKGGESSYHVKAGDKVDFTAQVVGHPSTFAAQVGVDPDDGAAQLTAQKAHIEVNKGAIKLTTS